MPISRRIFLKSGTLTALAWGLVLRPNVLAFGQNYADSAYQISLIAQQQPTYMFTRATFDPYVGGIFQSPDASGRMISLTLLSATPYKPSTVANLSTAKIQETDSFSLMFKAARALPEFRSIHTISHPSLGKFDLFLTPQRQTNGVMLYEAVFNHI
jgi:hypothetical protein